MSDVSEGEGWWMASDMKWYPPQLADQSQAHQTQPNRGAPITGSDGPDGPGWWLASDGRYYPPDPEPAAVESPAAKSKNRIFALLAAVLLIITIGLAIAISSGSGVNLAGRWVTHDYGCGGPNDIPETVEIVQTGEHIIGTKIVGDDCVRAGHRTFQGVIVGNTGLVTFWAGRPGVAPTLLSQTSRVNIINPDKVTLLYPGGALMTYSRVEGSSEGLWLRLLVPLVILSALGYLALSRRRRRHNEST